MQRFLTFLIAAGMTLGSFIARAEGDPKTAALLAQARLAIGGDQQIAKVQGLACSGSVLRTVGDRQVSGEVTIDVQLPDKMLRTESISPLGDIVIVTEQGINGDKLLRRSRTINAPPGAMIRTPAPPPSGSDAEAQALRNSRAELARFAIAMLLAPPASFPVEFTYAGEAEAPEGKADVLDVKGTGGTGSFAAKLFLDKSTHRLLMLAYRGIAPRVVVQTQRADSPPPSHVDTPAPEGSEPVDINMFLDDYRSVDGVMMPHHITRAVRGETNEEWTFKAIKANPTFRADTFSAK